MNDSMRARSIALCIAALALSALTGISLASSGMFSGREEVLSVPKQPLKFVNFHRRDRQETLQKSGLPGSRHRAWIFVSITPRRLNT